MALRSRHKEPIPQLELQVGHEDVSFAMKTAEDIEAVRMAGEETVGPHSHNYYTILWVTEGKGIHQIDFREYPISDNTIFFVSPGQVHHVWMEVAPRGYVVLFTEDFIEKHGIPREFMNGLRLFFACDAVRVLRPDADSGTRLDEYIRRMQNEYRSENPLRDEMISAWLKLFLLECKRIAGPGEEDLDPVLTSQARLVRSFKQLVEQHFRKYHKVSDYARMLAITSNYLNEVIKSETGISPKDVIQQRILLESKRLALYAEISLKEAAYTLGFDDPAHFGKFIRKMSGSSFSELKEQLDNLKTKTTAV